MIDQDTQAAALVAIRAMEEKQDADEVFAIFKNFVRPYGFRHVAIGHLVNPAIVPPTPDRWFMKSDYPDEWIERYRRDLSLMFDPVVHHALRTKAPFTWERARERVPNVGHDLTLAARDFGLTDGLAIPIHDWDRPSGCVGLAAERGVDLSPAERGMIELVALHAYSQLERLSAIPAPPEPEQLTEREHELLHWMVAGKSNSVMAQILNLSEYTVRDRANAVCRKLGAANRTIAAAIAISRGLVLPG